MIAGDAIKTAPSTALKRYRLPGIEREGIAQLSLLETALWPLQGGKLPTGQFQTRYEFTTDYIRKTAAVTVRAALGLNPIDELVLWGLLGATINRGEVEPVLLATPYWMLRHLGMETGGSQYAELRESLLRIAVTSYQNTAFYNPDTHEHEHAAFQFLSMLLPTVGGAGDTVDNDRLWRIEWNPAFLRFCRATGGTLLFDLDLFRDLTPASRRLFLKLKDRFWRMKRVFMNVDELTIDGLGFSASRPLKKRKYDLLNCIRELLDCRVIELGRGQVDPKELFLKRGKGSYVVAFYEGEYFRQQPGKRTIRQQDALQGDPLYDPLRKIGIDGPAIRRLFRNHSRKLIHRWVRITDAAMHEKPRGFTGFRVSPAAFLIDGIENGRTAPDWMHVHEKRQREKQWEQQRTVLSAVDTELRSTYDQERAAAFQEFVASPEGEGKYQATYPTLLVFYQATDPVRGHETAREATLARMERLDFQFPEFGEWFQAKHRLESKTSI